jgi:RimJ/RimL family protein N-acetyltransferase
MEAHTRAFSFRHLTADDLRIYRQWFVEPTVWMWMVYPSDEWFAFVNGAYSRCWGVFDRDNVLTAVIQVDVEDGWHVLMNFVVAPASRGRAIGSRVIEAFLSGPGRVWAEVEVDVESDNVAAIQCLHGCGFHPRGPGHDDSPLVQFVRRQAIPTTTRPDRSHHTSAPTPRRAVPPGTKRDSAKSMPTIVEAIST